MLLLQQLLLVSKLLRLLLQLLLHLPEELLRCSIHGHSSAMRREMTASNDREEDEARAREATTEAGLPELGPSKPSVTGAYGACR